jgi:hypothetical protein
VSVTTTAVPVASGETALSKARSQVPTGVGVSLGPGATDLVGVGVPGDGAGGVGRRATVGVDRTVTVGWRAGVVSAVTVCDGAVGLASIADAAAGAGLEGTAGDGVTPRSASGLGVTSGTSVPSQAARSQATATSTITAVVDRPPARVVVRIVSLLRCGRSLDRNAYA